MKLQIIARIGADKKPLAYDIAAIDAFSRKDILKANGFRWDAMAHAWRKPITNNADLPNMAAEIFMLCGMSFDEMEDSYCSMDQYAEENKIDWADMSEDVTNRFNAYQATLPDA